MRTILLSACMSASVLMGATSGLAMEPTGLSIKAETQAFGPARQIMRFSDGRLVGSVVNGKSSPLIFAVRGTDAASRVEGSAEVNNADAVTSDSGAAGTYVLAATRDDKLDLLLYPDAQKNPNRYERLVSAGLKATHLVLAASKGEESTGSVAYAYVSPQSHRIMLSYSADGRHFPPARPVGPTLTTDVAPALALHNRYVILSYLAPGAAGLHASFIESWNGGETWSNAAPVGASGAASLRMETAYRGANGFATPMSATGPARGLGNSLAWAQPEIGARIFVLTEQAFTSTEPGLQRELSARPRYAAVLSFKDLSEGPTARWQQVIASEYMGEATGAASVDGDLNYSALPGTSLRAVAYKEVVDSKSQIRIAVSINTGKSFDRHVVVSPALLGGILPRDAVLTSSPCLYADASGNVALDLLVAARGREEQAVVTVPLGVNLAELPKSLFNSLTRWP